MTTFERRLVETYRRESHDAQHISDALCDYQAERAAELLRRLRPEHSMALLGDPVGTGKTVIALVVAARLLHAHKVQKILVLVPNSAVARIWLKRSGWLKDEALQKALNVRTMRDLPVKDTKNVLIIVDEAHRRLKREQLDKLLRSGQHASHRRLFLSATPFQISVGALKELIGLGDLEQRQRPVLEALEKYGREVTHLARTAARMRDAGSTEAKPEVREAFRTAAANWAAVQGRAIVPPPTRDQLHAIRVVEPPALQLMRRYFPLNAGAVAWPEGFHIARILAELRHEGPDKTRATDSLQRQLVSSNEAFWGSRVASRACMARSASTRELAKELRERLGSGTDHPKVHATVSWVREQVRSGSHVAVFCVWNDTAKALEEALRDDLSRHVPGATVRRPAGQVIGADLLEQFQDAKREPLVLVLQDRFSESIDLDGGHPALVHHDLPWNPARLRQRWGRLVRARSGFQQIPKKKIFIPVLEHESDRRVFETVCTRARIGQVLLSDETAFVDDYDASGAETYVDLDEESLEALAPQALP
jgi:superfamily II DNA or RNA helicase